MSLRALLKKEYQFVGVFKPSQSLNFHVLQALGFCYFFYWIASKDFSVYGFLQHNFGIHREFVYDGYPVPLSYFTTFHFIYALVPRITPEGITALQWLVLSLCLLGVVGIVPRVCAAVIFLVTLHLVGLEALSNGNLDGCTTLPLCLMLVLALSPRKIFYQWGERLPAPHIHYHWPVFLFYLLVSAYYTTSGFNKLVDIGPHWPMVLHVDRLAAQNVELALFRSHSCGNPWVLSWFHSNWLSMLCAIGTIIGETFFFAILFFPRWRIFFIVNVILMHVLIFQTHGLNYTGNGLIALACLDFNAMAGWLRGQRASSGRLSLPSLMPQVRA